MNSAFCKMLGYSEEEMAQLCMSDITVPEDLQVSTEVLKDIQRREIEHFTLEKRYKHNNSGTVYAIVSGVALYDEEGNHNRTIATIEDITERKRAEETLLKRTRELKVANRELHDLTMEITRVEDAERKKFAEVLHDDIGQKLVAIEMGISVCARELDQSSGEMAKRLSGVNTLLRDTIESIRSMSSDLYTSNPYEEELIGKNGFVDAAAWYVEYFLEPAGVSAEMDIDEKINELPNEYKLCIYRILQESFQNIVKHASASSVKLRCKVYGDKLFFSVKDDGTGLSGSGGTSKEERAGVGLRLMRERVKSMNGRLTINSACGVGTEVAAEFPWSKSAQSE